jgi:GDP-4-dehydro-6-deoxy-D-mannose reductase
MRAWVSGGDGFVGEHLISWMLAQGDDVTASTLASGPDLRTLSASETARVEWKTADVQDAGSMAAILREVRPEGIFHLAGFSSGARSREQPARAFRVNAEGTLNLLEAVVGVRRDDPSFDPTILVMSSADVYGLPEDPDMPVAEDHPVRPVTRYGASKAATEVVANAYRRGNDLRIIVTRIFPLIGPGQSSSFVLPSLCGQVADIAAGKVDPVLQVGNLAVERDFTDVRDGVQGLRLLAERSGAETTYNVCSGRTVRIAEMVEWVLEEAGVEVEVEVRSDVSRVRPREPMRVVGEGSRLEAATGWRPTRSLRSAVHDTYQWILRSSLG